MEHAQQFELKPFEYNFEGKTYTMNSEAQIIVSRNFATEEFHTIRVYGLEDFLIKEIEIGAKGQSFLDNMAKKGHFLNPMYARFLKSKHNGELVYDFGEDRIKSIREQSGLLLPVRFNPKQGYALLQKVSQILVEEQIASDMMREQGLDKVINDKDFSLVKQYFSQR